MSNATSPPAKSLARGETPPKPEYTGEVTEQDVFPFLVHSQDSVTNGEPPEVDNAKLARQKRKRTSPEDQATLEAEYKKNPKPDKTARIAIVEQVSLGEKEVQIWFQNRRQNTRRKSRPLLPHEIAAFGLSPMNTKSGAPESTKTSQNGSFTSSQPDALPSNSQPQSSPEQHRPSSSPQLKEPTTISLATPAPARTTETSLPTFTPLNGRSSLNFHDTYNSYNAYSYAPGFSHSQPTTTPGYLANRWNMSSICGTPQTQKAQAKFMTPGTGEKGGFMTPGAFNDDPDHDTGVGETPSSCPLPLSFANDLAPTPPSNNVRLSLSLDGRAELVSADLSSSPPHAPPPRPASALSSIRRTPGLQRSLSATAAVPFSLSRSLTSTPISASSRTPLPPSSSLSASSGLPRLPTGRSRDASTWHLCADLDARDELTMHADNESNGSAVAAISLIRSTSGKALKPNANKRNAATGGSKEQNGSGKKARRTLGRGVSALGRLQSSNVANVSNVVARAGGKGERLVGEKEGGGGGDSDKENWLPGSASLGQGPRRVATSFTRTRSSPSKPTSNTIARAKTLANTNANSSTPLTGRQRSRKGAVLETKIFEDVDGSEDEQGGFEGDRGGEERERREKETSEEVERFMAGVGTSPGKKGDLDCIQGLLSLSQGNWR